MVLYTDWVEVSEFSAQNVVYKERQAEVLRADGNYDNLNLISNIRVLWQSEEL